MLQLSSSDRHRLLSVVFSTDRGAQQYYLSFVFISYLRSLFSQTLFEARDNITAKILSSVQFFPPKFLLFHTQVSLRNNIFHALIFQIIECSFLSFQTVVVKSGCGTAYKKFLFPAECGGALNRDSLRVVRGKSAECVCRQLSSRPGVSFI